MNAEQAARCKRAQRRITQALTTIRDAAKEIEEIQSSSAAPPRAVALGTGVDQTHRKTA